MLNLLQVELIIRSRKYLSLIYWRLDNLFDFLCDSIFPTRDILILNLYFFRGLCSPGLSVFDGLIVKILLVCYLFFGRLINFFVVDKIQVLWVQPISNVFIWDAILFRIIFKLNTTGFCDNKLACFFLLFSFWLLNFYLFFWKWYTLEAHARIYALVL